MHFVKVFSDIIQSSIWAEDSDTCKVWVTLLALSNQDGLVRATAPGISNAARVPIERTREIITLLESPDTDSRTPDNEGRRIERTDGGYLILNYLKYREMSDMAIVREQTRQRVAAYRKRNAVTQCNVTVQDVTLGNAKEKEKKKYKEPPIVPQGGHVRAPSLVPKGDPDWWAEFWKEFPRKEDKKLAIIEWNKLPLTDALVNKMLDALHIQKLAPKWAKDKIFLYACRWLSHARWEDEINQAELPEVY
jgi:hypothetical protein